MSGRFCRRPSSDLAKRVARSMLVKHAHACACTQRHGRPAPARKKASVGYSAPRHRTRASAIISGITRPCVFFFMLSRPPSLIVTRDSPLQRFGHRSCGAADGPQLGCVSLRAHRQLRALVISQDDFHSPTYRCAVRTPCICYPELHRQYKALCTIASLSIPICRGRALASCSCNARLACAMYPNSTYSSYPEPKERTQQRAQSPNCCQQDPRTRRLPHICRTVADICM